MIIQNFSHAGQTFLTTCLSKSVHLALFGIGVLPIFATANALDSSKSLNKLSEYYQSKPSVDARCHGVWIQPQPVSLTNHTGESTEQNTAEKTSTLDVIYAQADYGYWDNQDYAELSGDVIVEQNGQQVRADKISFIPSSNQAFAEGQVLFSDNSLKPSSEQSHNGTKPNNSTKLSNIGIIGVAEKLEYTTDGTHAAAQDVAFASTGIGAHGYAKALKKVSNHQYQMQGVMFSTCPPNERKWHLDADNIDINNDTGRAIAKNSTLKIGNTPIFYLPYFNFPIDNRRASGFLLPSAGFGSNSLEVSTPYYFNLHPQYDLTVTPTVFSTKNPMITGEFRYLTTNFGQGNLVASFLPNDRKYNGNNRQSLFFNHQWQAQNIPHLSAYAQYRYVSDSDYLNDFDTLGISNNPLNLSRRIGASYYNDFMNVDLRAETFQTLKGTDNNGIPLTDKDKPYSRLPQLAMTYSLPSFGYDILDKVKITGKHQSAYFKKSIKDNSEAEKSGTRMYNQLSASYPMIKPWGYITPKFSLIHLYASYDEDSLAGQNLSKKAGTYSVFAPQVSLDTGLFFEKSGSPFNLFDELGGYQTISPRLKYIYTPYKNQKSIPNFDTTISQISYNQLLADSWFLGYDRIQDLHAVTPALNYRYVDKHGRIRFDGGIAEQILLENIKVGIDNSETFTGHNSGLAWQFSTQPKENIWLDAAGAVKSNYDLNSVVAQLRYQPNEQGLFNVGFIKRREHKATGQLALSAYTASAIFPINNRWRLLSQAQYDQKNGRLLDILTGVNYEDCCYGVSIYARRYRNDLTPNSGMNNAIMAEIRLNGLSSGGKLNRIMSDKVMGYDNAQNAWQQNN